MAINADPSPQYIETDERASVVEMLAHVHEFSQLIVVLTGDVGSGRSSVLEHLSEQLSVHYQTLSFSAVNLPSLEDIQYEIATQLGCLADPQEIEQALHGMAKQSEPFHLLVDDAHLLSDDALTYLMFHSQGEHRWHLMLTGDVVLQDMCLQVQHNLQHEDLLHHVSLQPLSEEATTQFLQGLYRREGIDQLPLSDKALHHYWRLSHGLPGQLMHMVDPHASSNQKQSIASGLPIGHIAAVVLIGSALLVSYFYKSPEKTVSEEDAIARLIAGEAVVTEVLKSEAAAPSGMSDTQDSEAGFNQLAEDQLGSQQTSLESQASKDQPKAAAQSPQIKPQEVSVARQSKSVDPLTIDQKTEHPLLSAKPSDFGLQLVGVRKKQSAVAVVEEFAPQLGENKLSIYTTQYKGQPWYVVVYAPIKGKDSANKTAGQLSKLMSTQPWVRPMEKIQEDIRKNDQITD